MIKDIQILKQQPLGRLLSGTSKDILRLIHSKLNSLDIERNYYALTLIGTADGNITQQELANLLGTDKVSVVRIIDYLSDNGYVKRVRNIEDRRKYSITITDKAVKALPKIKKTLTEVTGIALKGLKQNEIDEFYSTLIKIKNNLNKSLVVSR